MVVLARARMQRLRTSARRAAREAARLTAQDALREKGRLIGEQLQKKPQYGTL